MPVHALTHAGGLAVRRTTFCGLQVFRLIDNKGWSTHTARKRIGAHADCKKCLNAMPKIRPETSDGVYRRVRA